MPSLTTLLKRDHREVKAMLKELAESEPGADRDRMLDEVERSLLLHMEIEERIVYPAVKRVEGDETAEEASVEHRLARKGLATMRSLSDVPGFGAAVEMLLGGITHHVKEEEQEVLPQLEKALPSDEWDELGRRALAARESGTVSLPRRTATKSAATKSAATKSAAKTAGKTGAASGSRSKSGAGSR